MSGNWIVQNISKALDIWNEKINEIWTLVCLPPQEFRNGGIWRIMTSIHSVLQAVGYALLVLFFLAGAMRTCGSLAEFKRPETAVRMFVRFALSKATVTYSLTVLTSLMEIGQGIADRIMTAAGISGAVTAEVPDEIVQAVDGCSFLESVPLWAITLIGGLLVWVLSFTMILNVYGRFFRIYLYTAIAPLPLSAFAGEPTQSAGMNFLRNYASVCLEGAVTLLGCVIFSAFAATPPAIDASAAPAVMVWSWFGGLIFNMLILVGIIRMSDRVVREITGI